MWPGTVHLDHEALQAAEAGIAKHSLYVSCIDGSNLLGGEMGRERYHDLFQAVRGYLRQDTRYPMQCGKKGAIFDESDSAKPYE